LATEQKYKTIKEKYKIQRYHFFESIFRQVTGEAEFTAATFLEEFKKGFRLEAGKILPQYQVLQNLDYTYVYDLDDQAYRENVLQMLEFAKKGLYKPAEYLSVTYYVERFDNFLGLDLDQAQAEITEGLKKAITYNGSTGLDYRQFDFSGSGAALSQRQQAVFKAGIAFIKQEEKDRVEYEILKLAKQFCTNPYAFLVYAVQSDTGRASAGRLPFLTQLDPVEFAKTFDTWNSNTIHLFRQFLKTRYDQPSAIEAENPVLKKIHKNIDDYLQTLLDENRQVRHALFTLLQDDLREIIATYST